MVDQIPQDKRPIVVNHGLSIDSALILFLHDDSHPFV